MDDEVAALASKPVSNVATIFKLYYSIETSTYAVPDNEK
jgi:hypothetical protein